MMRYLSHRNCVSLLRSMPSMPTVRAPGLPGSETRLDLDARVLFSLFAQRIVR